MQKIVINRCFGGYGLSTKAIKRWAEIKGIPVWCEPDQLGIGITCWTSAPGVFDRNFVGHYDIERNDPALVQAVEELGEQANGMFAQLKVVEVPDGVEWGIVDYDGIEHIAEKHRTWP